MNIVDKKEIVDQFNELLPWEKIEVIDAELNNVGEDNIAEYLFGVNGKRTPFDFVTAEECVNHYGADDLMEEMYDADVEEYIKSHPTSISSYALISALSDRWVWGKTTYITDTNLQDLEDLIKEIKKYKEQLNK